MGRISDNKTTIIVAIVSLFSGSAITKCAEAFVMVSDEVQDIFAEPPQNSTFEAIDSLNRGQFTKQLPSKEK